MYKVYLLDDEPFILEGLKYIVDWEDYGFEIVGSANNGEDGLKEILSMDIDLVLTDIMMPKMTGLELIDNLIKSNYHTNFIVLSAFQEFEYAKKAISMGAENYILKPIDSEELEKSIINIKKKLKENESRSKDKEVVDNSLLLKIITENSVVKKHIQDAETVIISIGGNDFLHLGYESSITELLEIISKGRDSDVINTLVTTVEKNIHLIHESIRELNPKAKIVLQNVYNPFLGHKDRITQVLNDLVQIFRQDFIDIYNNEASTDSNMIIADVEKVFREYYEETNSTELIQSDFIHPSVKGHALIAETDEKAMDDVHKAGWSTLEKSASALLRLAERNVVENNAEETGTGTTE